MTKSLDQIHRRIDTAAKGGFTRTCGYPLENLNLSFYTDYAFIGPTEATFSLSSDVFTTLLLDLRPERTGFPDDDRRRAFEQNLNSIANLTKPYITNVTDNLVVAGLNNDPEGFGPSAPIATIEWCLVAFAQEKVAELDFGYTGPLKATDLMVCLEAGRLPCGWRQLPRRGELLIY